MISRISPFQPTNLKEEEREEEREERKEGERRREERDYKYILHYIT